MKDYLFQSSVEFAGALKNNYVDKTEIISYLNSRINVPTNKFICAVRPCRSGKSITAMMLNAYYSKANDTKNLFVNLKIGQDPNFENYLNKYHVLYIDMQDFDLSIDNEGIGFIDRIHKDLIKTLKKHFPKAFENKEFTDVALAIREVYAVYQEKFIFIIDEWDCILRDKQYTAGEQKKYLDFIRNLLKDKAYVSLAYMTGILPIKKYGTHSALNMFDEYSMTNPGEYTEFVGFTETEVKDLCEGCQVDFDAMKSWYDGYTFPEVPHVYNPKSVVDSIRRKSFASYWTQTETYEALKIYIDLNYDGLMDAIVEMLAGEHVAVNTERFQNDMTTFESRDDVLTLLVHLGYLAFDREESSVFIPNVEIRG